MPLVTAVISTYNRAPLVGQAIRSALEQTSVPGLEVVVVDDGSTDDTAAVLGEFGDRIRVVYQANRERGAARNAGLRAARGEFVAFLDSDDYWFPDKIQRELTTIRGADAVLTYSGAMFVDGGGRPLGRVRMPSWSGDVLRKLALGNFVPVGAHLLRREAFLQVGGFSEDRALSGSEDWEAWVRLAAVGTFIRTPGLGLNYRQHPGCTTANHAEMRRSMLEAHSRIFGNPALHSRVAGLRMSSLGRAHLVLASLAHAGGLDAEAREHHKQALRTSPALLLTAQFWDVGLRACLGRRSVLGLRRLLRRV